MTWVIVNDWHKSRYEGRLLRIQAGGEPGQSDKRPKVVRKLPDLTYGMQRVHHEVA